MMKIKKHVTIIIVLLFFGGASLLLYPTISGYVSSLKQSRTIASYEERVSDLCLDECDRIIAEALDYNRSLVEKTRNFHLSEEQAKKYPEMLRVSDSDVMAVIEIPKINCILPIYHGTDEDILSDSVGHVEWSSLPVGGTSSHCVIAGHRGLANAKLFTDLDKLEIGDTFNIRVLNMVITYEVDQILTVEPDDVSSLTIESGKDYCTLVTCTPYGVNSHRLLIRGNRTENVN